MGSRIQKNIGYFLSKEKVNSLFVQDYRDVLEKFYEDDKDDFLNNLKMESENSKNVFFSYIVDNMIEDFKKNNLSVYNIIKTIYFGDDFKGILLQTNEMAKLSRSDNLLDYLECNKVNNKINYLHRPIYPLREYTYEGGFDESLEKLMREKFFIKDKNILDNNHSVTVAIMLNRILYDNKFKLDTQKQITTLLTKEGFFHPKIDSEIYFIAKYSGLLLDHIPHGQFDRFLEPVIITYWS